MAQVSLFGEIFLKLSLGTVDGVLIGVPDEMFRFWVSIGGGDIGFTINVNGFDLPIGKITELFLDKIFQVVGSEVGLNVFGDRIENLV